jgi:hypothetical protein
MSLSSIYVAMALLATSAWGQLYLVTGSQSSKSPEGSASVLFRVGDAGEIERVEEIVSQDAGTWFIEISSESRKLVAFSPSDGGNIEARFTVVDLDKPGVVKACPMPRNTPGYVAFAEWLADVRGKGLTMLQQSAVNGFANRGLVRGMSLDASVPCDESFETIAPADIEGIVVNGQAGVAGLAANEYVDFAMDRDGKIMRRFAGGDVVYLGYQVPEVLRSGLDLPYISVMVNNSDVLVVGIIGKGAVGATKLIALRKSDRTWHLVPSLQGDRPVPRSVGHYLAIPERHLKSAAFPESAGGVEWRKARGEMGPSIAEQFRDSDLVYPGKLHLYDLDSEKVYTIDTKQGDSEVLLVEDGKVYYRASDRLYSAPITNSGIGTARLLATDDAIRDTHWAFIKH